MGLFGALNTKAAVELVSAPEQPLLSASGGDFSMVSTMRSTGRFILFVSPAGDLVTNTLNGVTQLFLRDRDLGKTVLVSATPEAAAADGASIGCFVDDTGQTVVFQSDASDLGPEDDNDETDIYRRDLLTGANTLLSTSTNGAAGNGASRYPITTPDGLFVAFESRASDLVANDTNQAVDVFVRDIKTGLITLASQLPTGFVSVAKGDNELNGVSTNGQYVLFTASCAKKSAASQTARHVFLRDTVSQTTHWISSNIPPMNQSKFANLDCCKASMTPDASYFLFMAARPGQFVTPGDAVVCRHEFLTGTTTVIATNPVVVLADGTENLDAVISDDGRFVAYTLSGNASAMMNQVYRWDSVTGSNILASANADGITPGSASSDSPLITSDGRTVIFETLASNIVSQDLRGEWNLILRDMDTGLSRLASATRDGLSGAGSDPSMVCASSGAKSIAFSSRSAMIVPGDANNTSDVFVWNADSGGTELISMSDPRAVSATVPGLHSTFVPSISADGRFIAFASFGSTLAAGDTNEGYDAFIRDTVAGTTRLVTANATGTTPQNGGLSSPPSLSDDGRFVAFASLASDLNERDTNDVSDVYVRDVLNKTNILVSKNVLGVSGGNPGSSDPVIAPGGEFVLFTSKASNIVQGLSRDGLQRIYRYDMRTGTNMDIPYIPGASSYGPASILSASYDKKNILVRHGFDGRMVFLGVFNLDSGAYRYTTNGFCANSALSGNGQRLAYTRKQAATVTFELVYVDVTTQTELAAITLDTTALSNLCLNEDGSRVAYAMVPAHVALSNYSQVYVWDAATGSNILVSVNMAGQPGNGSSKLVAISPDGGRVVFNSHAEDLAAADQNGWTDIYVRDLASQQTRLLSLSRTHEGSGNSLSTATALSLDGKSVVFTSSASDLIENDLNGQPDLFVLRIADLSNDVDNDGLPDAWERVYFTDLSHSAAEDADRDGSPNVAEFEAGTNPADPDSALRISGLAPQPGNGLRLSWTTVSGKTYRLQYKDTLADARWTDLAGDVTSSGPLAEIDVSSAEQDCRYYRVIVVK